MNPDDAGLHLFDTAVGTCGVAWGPHGLRAVQLPEATQDDTVARLLRRAPADALEVSTPPSWVREAVELIRRHLAGEAVDLGAIRLDDGAVPDFHRAVYRALRAVRPGRTVSYGELAGLAGSPGAARAIGQAMARNPWPVVVPCHRVLGSGRANGGFSAYGGLDTKARLLEIEGVRLEGAFQPTLTPRIGRADFDAARATRELADADPKLGALIARVGAFAMAIEETPSVYEALARAVVFQQLAGKAALTIWNRVLALSPDGRLFAPEALRAEPEERLRGAGLSAAKLAALRDLAAKTLDGTVPTMAEAERLGDEALVERLTSVRGVGRWTVEMFLMFRLGRPDVLPLGDYGVRNGFRAAFGLREVPAPDRVAKRGARWRPWRTVASWYLWRAVDLERGGAP